MCLLEEDTSKDDKGEKPIGKSTTSGRKQRKTKTKAKNKTKAVVSAVFKRFLVGEEPETQEAQQGQAGQEREEWPFDPSSKTQAEGRAPLQWLPL